MTKGRYIGLLSINLIIVISAIFVIIKISVLPAKMQSMFLSEDISQTALQFNVENFHTQLEMWEYAYQPNNERLEAFEQHSVFLNSNAEKFINLAANNQNALYNNGLAHAEKIISDLKQVQEDWGYLLPAVENYKQLLESGASDAEIKQARDTMDNLVFANENLFDRLEFNKEVEDFTIAQSKHTNGLKSEIDFLINFSRIGITAMFVLLVTGVIVSSMAFFKIGKNFWVK